MSRRRFLGWTGIFLYVLTIYATLPCAPAIQKLLVQKLGEPAGMLGGILTVLLGLTALIYYFVKKRGARLRILISTCIVTTLYILAFYYLVVFPPEQFHFAEYGLLSWLLFFMARKGRSLKKTVLLVLALGLAAGMMDEIIQHFLPQRHFEWRDMLINIVATLLGLISVVLIAGSPEPASPLPKARGYDLTDMPS